MEFDSPLCSVEQALQEGDVSKWIRLHCTALPLASSSGPLDRLFRARPSTTLQANLGPSQTVTQATTLLEVEEDSAMFLTHVMCSQAPRDTIGVPKRQWSYHVYTTRLSENNNNLEKQITNNTNITTMSGRN
jgi:hypothetical protein